MLILLFFIISLCNQGLEKSVEYTFNHPWRADATDQLALESKGATTTDPAAVKGVYSLMKGMEPVNPAVLRLPFVEGVSIRIHWDDIEPEEGRFDWSYLDNALHEVEKANKKAMVRILPGIHSPEWIYKKGIASIEFKDANPHHKTYGKLLRMPVPWDESYIKEWTKFVNVLGKRYGSNDALVLVHMAGPTASSAEMHIPKKGEGKTLIQEAGYSRDKIVEAWREVIDAYSNAFPQKALALNIAVPFRRDGALEEVVQYAVSKMGKRLCVQGNWLSAHTANSFYPYKVILDIQKNNSANIGFQMLGASKHESRQGSLDMSVEKGLLAGAMYFEIYQVDILEPDNRQFLEELDKRLTAVSTGF